MGRPGLSAASTRRGLPPRAQRAALRQQAGLWNDGWAAASRGRLGHAAGASARRPASSRSRVRCTRPSVGSPSPELPPWLERVRRRKRSRCGSRSYLVRVKVRARVKVGVGVRVGGRVRVGVRVRVRVGVGVGVGVRVIGVVSEVVDEHVAPLRPAGRVQGRGRVAGAQVREDLGHVGVTSGRVGPGRGVGVGLGLGSGLG